jgi:hypothetical protein
MFFDFYCELFSIGANDILRFLGAAFQEYEVRVKFSRVVYQFFIYIFVLKICFAEKLGG